MKSARPLIPLMLIALALIASPAAADDLKEHYDQVHAKYENQLSFGNVSEKLLAIAWMGTLRKHRFVRPLCEELIHGMDDAATRKMAAYDPYVKSRIATALGYLGRKEALPFLKKALEFTNAVLEEQRKTYEARAQKAQAEKSYEIILPVDREGPAVLKEGYLFPVSPDGYWSLAGEFKSSDYDPNDESMRVRMEGYNYVNLAHHLLIAIGDISDPEGLDLVLPFLEHPYKDVRLAATLAAAQLGGEKALSALLARYEKETDDQVKARLAFGILHLDTTRGNVYRDLMNKYLRSSDLRVRLDAASALRELALGESLFQLHDAFLLETHPIVKSVLLQAIHNANLDNILPPNRVLDTGPTRIWIHGEPLQPSESAR